MFCRTRRDRTSAPLRISRWDKADNVNVRFAASMALTFNVATVVIAIVAIAMTVPKNHRSSR
jgi:hypothetical protein